MNNTSVTVFLDLTTTTKHTRATLSLVVSGTVLNLMFSSALLYSLTLSNKVSLVRIELSSTSAVSLTACKAALRRVN